MNFEKNNIIEKNFFFSLISFSLIISENYFFLWNKRFLIHPSYLFFNTLFLFLTSFVILYLFLNLYKNFKFKYYFNFQFKIILLTYISVKLIEIPFFYSNVITLTVLFENFFLIFLDNNLLILFLKKITPFILVYILIYFFCSKKLFFLQKFIFSFSIIFLIIMVILLSNRFFNYEKINLNIKETKNDRKVVWILFDEFDPSIAFKDSNKLKNFEQLTKKSFVLNNSYSPSSHTMESMPSIFMSRNVKDIEYKNFKIFLTNQNHEKKEFNFKNTFLNFLEKENFDFQIISEVLPYCFMLELETNCENNQAKFKNYFDSIISNLTPINYLKKLKDINDSKKRDKAFSIEDINKDIELNDNFFFSKELKFDLKDFKNEINSEKNLVFFHLFLPKINTVASKHVENFYNLKLNDDSEKYKVMLSYIDLITKGVQKEINEKSKDEILLIISSDHWLRESSDKPKPSLFIAKINSDHTKIYNEKKVMNIFIPDLIIKFLQKKISSHIEINKYIELLDDINLNQINNNLK